MSLGLKIKQILKKRRMKKMEETILNPKGTEIDEKPPYPSEPGKGDLFTDRIVAEPGKTEQAIVIDIKALGGDIVRAGFQTANLINPKIREATEQEVRNIGLPLANVIEKYNLVQYAKYMSYAQEVSLAVNLIKAVQVRVKEVRETPTRDDKV
jgi:hypothetical protein